MNDLGELLLLEEHNCASCGIRFAMPAALNESRRKDHRAFYCPNGHAMSYDRPKKPRDEVVDGLRAEIKAAREEIAALKAHVDQVEASRRPLFRRRVYDHPAP